MSVDTRDGLRLIDLERGTRVLGTTSKLALERAMTDLRLNLKRLRKVRELTRGRVYPIRLYEALSMIDAWRSKLLRAEIGTMQYGDSTDSESSYTESSYTTSSDSE